MPHDITDLRLFVTITKSGSLAEAARRLWELSEQLPGVAWPLSPHTST